MAIQTQGSSGTVLEVEVNTQAARTTPRPIDVGSLGSYSQVATSGVIGAGLVTANSCFFSFRWGTSPSVALIRKVSVGIADSTTAFAAGVVPQSLVMAVARNFTASDTGGTSVLPTGNSNKRRTSFGTTLVTDMRVASTTMVVAGTRTLDTQPFCSTGPFQITVTAGGIMLPKNALFAPDQTGEWPLVLAQNEGFVIVNDANAFPATGTCRFYCEVEWAELASF